MKVEEMKVEKMSVLVVFFNHVYAELLVYIIDLPLYTMVPFHNNSFLIYLLIQTRSVFTHPLHID